MDAEALTRLQAAIGWSFRDAAHLERALIHRSYCAEHPEAVSNERLEFLGDAVLGMVVTDFAFHEYPELPEGELAKLNYLLFPRWGDWAVVQIDPLQDRSTPWKEEITSAGFFDEQWR